MSRRNRINEDLIFNQNGNIWRLYMHGNILVGETRDPETKNAFIFSMDFTTGEIYLRNLQIDEKWWFSIAGITNNSIFLSKFRQPDMPDQKGIIVLDIKSGDKLWEDEKLIYLFSNSQDTYAYKELFESKYFYRLDSSNGNIISETKDESEIAHICELKDQFDSSIYRNFTYAERYNSGNNESDYDLDLYLSKSLKDTKLIGPVEYIKTRNLLLYNYHKDSGVNLSRLNESMCNNIFEICDLKKGKLLYTTILNQNTPGYAPDSFFINNEYLFFVRNKKELVIINLGKWK